MKLKTTARTNFTLAALILSLFGCSERNSLRQLSASELRELAHNCKQNPPSAPGQVIACQNIAKECTRRAAQHQSVCP